MKKILFSVMLCTVLILTGCGKEKEVSIGELQKIQNEINNKLEEYDDYKNFASCGVDEEKKFVIVELIDNSKKEQKWFKENVSDSKYIKFKQGGPYTTSELDFYITKPDNHNDIKFNDYYSTTDRIVYLAGNIKEFYITDESSQIKTLKYYISNTYQTFDDSIKSITEKLTKTSSLKDGGTTTYKSKGKDITLIVCNTIDGNKNVFIGDYSMEYEQDMCQ